MCKYVGIARPATTRGFAPSTPYGTDERTVISQRGRLYTVENDKSVTFHGYCCGGETKSGALCRRFVGKNMGCKDHPVTWAEGVHMEIARIADASCGGDHG